MKRPNGPRNLKAGGFTNGLWRLEERDRARKNSGVSIDMENAPESCEDYNSSDKDADYYLDYDRKHRIRS